MDKVRPTGHIQLAEFFNRSAELSQIISIYQCDAVYKLNECTPLALVMYRPRVSNSNCSVGKMRTYKVPEGRIVTLTQQWQYLNLTRNSFYILFPAKCIVS